MDLQGLTPQSNTVLRNAIMEDPGLVWTIRVSLDCTKRKAKKKITKTGLRTALIETRPPRPEVELTTIWWAEDASAIFKIISSISELYENMRKYAEVYTLQWKSYLMSPKNASHITRCDDLWKVNMGWLPPSRLQSNLLQYGHQLKHKNRLYNIVAGKWKASARILAKITHVP